MQRTLRIFFVQSLKMIAMQFFWKKIPSFPSFRNWEKSSCGHAECSCDNPAKIFLSNFRKLLLEMGKRWKIDKLSEKLIRQIVGLNMHNEILASLPLHCRQEYEEQSQKPKERSFSFFWTKLFYFVIKNDPLATENAILTTLAKTLI